MANKPTDNDNNNNLHDDKPPIAVHFPLRGEWVALCTPGHKIPSHGTSGLGQRFAYDFLTPEDLKMSKSYKIALRYWFAGGLPLSKSTSLHAPVFSPVNGTVIAAKDGWPDPKKLGPGDIFRILGLSFGLRYSEKDLKEDFRIIAGNYLLIKAADCHAFIAHASEGSILVAEGDKVKAGQHIANVGHTGNSSQPHLHFHLMDGPDFWTAKGLPCCFESYEELREDVWRLVENGIPGNEMPVRSVKGL